MKKNLLLITFSILSLNALFSQRSIDWSIEEVISPTQVVHGQSLTVHIVCKNNGPNDAEVGDTIFSRVLIQTGQNQLTPLPWIEKELGRIVEVNDTIHHIFTYNPNPIQITGLSFNGTLFIQSLLQNWGNINFEQQATSTNNLKTKPVAFINDKGWGVSVANVETNSVIVYPNPAVSNVNIDFATVQTSEKVSIEIYDLQGKLVYQSEERSLNGSFEVNVSNFECGIYIVKVINGNSNLTSKLVVE